MKKIFFIWKLHIQIFKFCVKCLMYSDQFIFRVKVLFYVVTMKILMIVLWPCLFKVRFFFLCGSVLLHVDAICLMWCSGLSRPSIGSEEGSDWRATLSLFLDLFLLSVGKDKVFWILRLVGNQMTFLFSGWKHFSSSMDTDI